MRTRVEKTDPRVVLFATLLVSAVLGVSVRPGAAQDAALQRTLAESEITLEKIRAHLDATFLETEIDRDGDLRISDSGVVSYARIDPDRKLITYFSGWSMRESVAEGKKLEFINRLNDELILVRFSMPRPTTLWCDYQFSYAGGISPYTMVNNFREFSRVVNVAAVHYDQDNIVGSD